MEVLTNFSLKNYNTFGVEAKTSQFADIHLKAELIDLLQQNKNTPKLILGGGSNILFTKNIKTLAIHINLRGKKIIKENNDFVWVEAKAGENWHEFVLWTISQNFGGLENLSLIPGNVGATPVQNIGAYGVEMEDNFDYCETVNMITRKTTNFSKKDCQFGYRESIFKNSIEKDCIITAVTFKLTKRKHKINTSYGAIADELNKKGTKNPTLQDISNAVITIRQSKLPNPKELGNGGSFFKNPILPKNTFEKIQKQYPEIPHYIMSETEVKIPAGWLIEQIGFKGKRFGDAGVHNNQALVLVNYGTATGQEILNLSETIQKTIIETFGIYIEREVNII